METLQAEDSAGKNSGYHPAPACTLVIFGAGGDLTKRLLMPSLYNLSRRGLLPADFRLVGVDLVAQSDANWIETLTTTMRLFTVDKTAEFYTPEIDERAWSWLCQRMRYIPGDFANPDTFRAVREAVGSRSAIFYFAVAARFFGIVAQGLGTVGLLPELDSRFRRIIVEKPFGNDLASAHLLNEQLLKVCKESQIYRIDHFLGKETVQSIMAVRFANGLFEPTWRHEYIDHVQITAAETVGVEGRGAFYEPTGALRDMVPNHLFTLLGMVAMEPPNSFNAEAVRSEKAKLLEAVMPVTVADVVRGQYRDGVELGARVPGYRDEAHVASDSTTETYVAMKVYVENWRWAGVPFYLRTGKRLAERRTEISIHFKEPPYKLFRDTSVGNLSSNVVRLLIDPEQGIETQFDAKIPGPLMRLGRVKTAMRYRDFFEDRTDVGYESLIYDCMLGDATLFQRADAIEASWTVVDPVLDAVASGGTPVELYDAGGQGPDAAHRLLEQDGRAWLTLGR